jgi:hypothetical protein
MPIDKRPKTRNRAPATTPEEDEQQVISMAVRLAKQQIQDGTASAQVISHYLKLGSTREKLEQERLARENALLQAKVDQLASAKRVEELYEQALNAMRTYAGQEPMDQDYDED